MMDGKMILFLVLRPCCAGAEIGLGVQRSFSGFLLRALLAIVPHVMSLRITAIILVLAFSTFLTALLLLTTILLMMPTLLLLGPFQFLFFLSVHLNLPRTFLLGKRIPRSSPRKTHSKVVKFPRA